MHKPFTSEMTKIFKILVEKEGYTYYRHTNDGSAAILLKRERLHPDHPALYYCICFIDYDNYSKVFTSISDPKENLNEFYRAFKFQKMLDEEWERAVKPLRKLGLHR